VDPAVDLLIVSCDGVTVSAGGLDEVDKHLMAGVHVNNVGVVVYTQRRAHLLLSDAAAAVRVEKLVVFGGLLRRVEFLE